MHTDAVQHLVYKENTCTLRYISYATVGLISLKHLYICFTRRHQHTCFKAWACMFTVYVIYWLLWSGAVAILSYIILIWHLHSKLMERPHSTLTQIIHLYPITIIFSTSIIHLSTCIAASDGKVAVWIKNNMKYFLNWIRLWCSICHSEIRAKYFIKHEHAAKALT